MADRIPPALAAHDILGALIALKDAYLAHPERGILGNGGRVADTYGWSASLAREVRARIADAARAERGSGWQYRAFDQVIAAAREAALREARDAG